MCIIFFSGKVEIWKWSEVHLSCNEKLYIILSGKVVVENGLKHAGFSVV